MSEYREEVVERTAPSAFPAAAAAAARPPPRRTVRRWWRRSVSAPAAVVTTEYANAPSYAEEPALGQLLRIAWFLLGLLEGVLALRFLLALLGANAGNSFAQLVYGLTWPFVAPFRTLFDTPSIDEAVFEGYTLVAMLVIFGVWWVGLRFLEVLLNRSVDA